MFCYVVFYFVCVCVFCLLYPRLGAEEASKLKMPLGDGRKEGGREEGGRKEKRERKSLLFLAKGPGEVKNPAQ